MEPCIPPFLLERASEGSSGGDICRGPNDWECPFCCRKLGGAPYCAASGAASAEQGGAGSGGAPPPRPCRASACQSVHPEIWTFFEQSVSGEEAQNAGMLALWKRAWSRVGWRPRVLTPAHAAKHPQYAEALAALKQIPLGPSRSYDLNCYLRHFGMAVVGGGWMADFDVLPLVMPFDGAPLNGGRYTVYEYYVPSLVSASAEEWTRMGLRLLEEGKKHREASLFSDMHALQALHRKGVYEYEERVAGFDRDYGHVILRPGPEACSAGKPFFAAHFSHAAMGVLSGSLQGADRARLAGEALERWRAHCKPRLPLIRGPAA